MAETDIDGLIRFADYLTPDVFTPLLDGQKFDIGDYVFETIICSGHTAGSVVFVDREKGIMFSGDSIGSGSLWMQIPGCLTITEFKSSLENLADRVADMKELKIYPGHRNQSPNQLTMPYIHDTLHIACGLVDGSIIGEDRTFEFGPRVMKFKSVAYGQMLDFCYNPATVALQE